MRQHEKPGRTAKITEPMNAVEIAELDLEFVIGGCGQCGNPQHNPLQPAPPANQNR